MKSHLRFERVSGTGRRKIAERAQHFREALERRCPDAWRRYRWLSGITPRPEPADLARVIPELRTSWGAHS